MKALRACITQTGQTEKRAWRELFIFRFSEFGFQGVYACVGDFYVVFGFASAECGDQVARFATEDDAAVPTDFSRHGWADLAAAVFEGVRHLCGFGVGDCEKVRSLICICGDVLHPADDEHLRTPGLKAVAFEVGYEGHAGDVEFASAATHGQQCIVCYFVEVLFGFSGKRAG
jgi:hypothetical protein